MTYAARMAGETQGRPQRIPQRLPLDTRGLHALREAARINSYTNPGDVLSALSRAELVTNGTFDTDTTGWTAGNSTLSVVAGRLRVTKTVAGVAGSAEQTIPVVAGQVYTLTGTTIGGTAPARIRVGSTLHGAEYGEIGNNATDSITFTATGTSVYIVCYAYDAVTVDLYAEFDDVSMVIGSTPGTGMLIEIAAHERIYPVQGIYDIPDLAIEAGSIGGAPESTRVWIFYDDPTLLDPTPVFQFTTVAEDGQVGAAVGRHALGYIDTPASGGTTSGGSGSGVPGGTGGGPAGGGAALP